MKDPFHHPFLTRDQTMYLSTINKQDHRINQPYYRQSSFLRNDIPGSKPRPLVSTYQRQNFSLSTYLEPVPNSSKQIKKISNSLHIDDIEGARPHASHFQTKRNVNPLCPKYILPTASEIMVDKGRKFIKDTLYVKDINELQKSRLSNISKYTKQPIEGTHPSNQTRYVNAKSRLQVKDINKGDFFESSRQVNPLEPVYNWRDNNDRNLSKSYGFIQGSKPIQLIKSSINRPNNLNLNVKDIEGAVANSLNARSHFIDKRRQFRNYMRVQDIQKTCASSLKKGITTKRNINPLMPAYQLPGHKQIYK